MASWVQNDDFYKFRQPNHAQETLVHVSGAMDVTGEERLKFVFAERDENKGASLDEAEARNHCISSFAKSLKIEPEEADWYTRDKDGQLHSVSVGYERVTKENPQYTALVNSGDLDVHRAEREAKPYMPDVTVNELRTEVQPLAAAERRDLSEAFDAARSAQPVRSEQSANQNQDVEPTPKGGREYDLSQERCFDR